LVRALLGRSVGLALGGGGALGFAHIGLIRALTEAKIPIDYVSGASFGALVAGIYSAGGLEKLEELIDRRNRLVLGALRAFKNTVGFERFVDLVVGPTAMGDTEIPFFPVSVDVMTGMEVVRSRGTVGHGVRSSSGLPGVYPTLQIGAANLADGGIHNNVPASVAWQAGAHFIVASNIIPTFPFDARTTSRRSRFLLRSEPVKRLDALVRSLFLLMSQTGRDRAQLADYVFDLDVRGYNIYDFIKGPDIADAGRRQAERQMAHIQHAYKKACG